MPTTLAGLPDEIEALKADRKNPKLPGYALPESLELSGDIASSIANSSHLLWALPAQIFPKVFAHYAPKFRDNCVHISVAKGVVADNLSTLSECAEQILQGKQKGQFAVLSGPSFAKEVARGLPTNVVVAGSSDAVVLQLQQLLSSDRFRVYSSRDTVGVELAGSVKNVIAIAAGAVDSLGLGHNAMAGLITRGLAEMSRLIIAKGGDLRTAAGLAGMGDLVLTCTGPLSRNRSVGVALGKGESLEQVLLDLGHVAEGVPTAESVHRLAKQLQVELPICDAVYAVLSGAQSCEQAIAALLQRPLRSEWSDF